MTSREVVKKALDAAEAEMPHWDSDRSPNDYLASAAIEALREDAEIRLAERLEKADKECWYDGPINGWCTEIDGEPWTLRLFIDAILGLKESDE